MALRNLEETWEISRLFFDAYYPPAGNGKWITDKIAHSSYFGKIALIVFAVGFLLGTSAGSEAYTVSKNTVGWHFVFSHACEYWIPAFLIGMVFIGLDKIISLLYEIRDCE